MSAPADIVREADPDRYLSVLYAPDDKRGDLFTLHAFDIETAAIRARIREPMAGEIRLQWWRDAIAAADGQGSPLADALIDMMARRNLPRTAFDGLLQARVFDLYDDPMPSRGDLEGYLGETAAAPMQLAAMILDRDAALGVAEACGHGGCALGIARLLRLLPHHRARGQCYVPAELLAAAGTSRDRFVSVEPGPEEVTAIRAMSALGREHLAAFRDRARGLPVFLRPAFLPIAPAASCFDRVEANPQAALTRPADISVLRRHWLLLRHAMRGWD